MNRLNVENVEGALKIAEYYLEQVKNNTFTVADLVEKRNNTHSELYKLSLTLAIHQAEDEKNK